MATIPSKQQHQIGAEGELKEYLSPREIGIRQDGDDFKLAFKDDDGGFHVVESETNVSIFNFNDDPDNIWQAACANREVLVFREILIGDYRVYRLAEHSGSTLSRSLKMVFSNFYEDRCYWIVYTKSGDGAWTVETGGQVYAPSDSIAPEWFDIDDPGSIKAGNLVFMDSVLYRSKVDAPAYPWQPSQWEQTTVAAELARKGENVVYKYIKSQAIVGYTLTGNTPNASVGLSDSVHLVLTRLDSDASAPQYFSGVDKVVIRKARMTLGGAGTVLSRGQVSATFDFWHYIDPEFMGPMSSDTDPLPRITLSQWDEWEEKNITIDSIDATEWKEGFRETRPYSLVFETSSVVNIADFNVQSDFVGQALSVYLELAVECSKMVTADGLYLVD